MQARAGSDVVAPSDMMDGRVGAIRDALDSGACGSGTRVCVRLTLFSPSLTNIWQRASRTCRSWRTQPSTRLRFTGRSVTPWTGTPTLPCTQTSTLLPMRPLISPCFN